ncbi:MAG: hypothetical protein DMD90_06355 [Candidatus Rokuibacteriota bacterium]|nr:MAG: hypothetical protein AUH76_06860 [Candidatus Rokubacteria bacterium 13_1_40CM_4_67_11]PYN67231.1 MAG: hypothetical protein DMD90_06355 [Candidatus Rokubacteria bacterium]
MTVTPAERRSVSLKVDPAFIAAVVFLRRSCSVNDMATILDCDRKRVLTVLARLTSLGVPVWKDPDAPRYRPLTQAQQSDVTSLFNNGRGLDFYALCRVMRDVHPLSLFVFLRNEISPRGWWMRACACCDEPFASPRSSLRFCGPRCAPQAQELAFA